MDSLCPTPSRKVVLYENYKIILILVLVLILDFRYLGFRSVPSRGSDVSELPVRHRTLCPLCSVAKNHLKRDGGVFCRQNHIMIPPKTVIKNLKLKLQN